MIRQTTASNPSRTRVLDVFAGRVPDQVPYYEQAVASSVASEILGREAHTGCTGLHREMAEAWLRGEDHAAEFILRVIDDWTEFADAVGMDAINVPWLGGRPTMKLGDTDYLFGDPDGRWSISRYDPENQTFGVVKTNAADLTMDDLEAEVEAAERGVRDAQAPTPGALHPLSYLIEKNAHRRAIVGGIGIVIPLTEPWLMAVALRPDLIDRHLAVQVERARQVAPVLGEMGVNVIFGGGDLADKNGCIYGPEVFRRHVLPCLQEIVKVCHAGRMPYVFRTDGNLWTIADDLFGASGVDGYGEIEQDAGMDPGAVRRHFPDLTMWGGVSCGTTLLTGTPGQVMAEATLSMGGACPGGGLILGCSNAIMHKTPVENMMAMLRARDQFDLRGSAS